MRSSLFWPGKRYRKEASIILRVEERRIFIAVHSVKDERNAEERQTPNVHSEAINFVIICFSKRREKERRNLSCVGCEPISFFFPARLPTKKEKRRETCMRPRSLWPPLKYYLCHETQKGHTRFFSLDGKGSPTIGGQVKVDGWFLILRP